jgi:hypothetical protein
VLAAGRYWLSSAKSVNSADMRWSWKCSRSFSQAGRVAFLQEEEDLLGRLGIGMGPAARSQEETHGGWQGLLRY